MEHPSGTELQHFDSSHIFHDDISLCKALEIRSHHDHQVLIPKIQVPMIPIRLTPHAGSSAKTLMNRTINSIKNIHSPHPFLPASTMQSQSPLYSRARMNALLAHQKSMPTLSSPSSSSPSPRRKSATEPNPQRSPIREIGPPPQYPPPAPPTPANRKIQIPGGGYISVQVRANIPLERPATSFITTP